MQKETTYYVERDGENLWLGRGVKPLKTDTLIEERIMLYAEEGKFIKKGDYVCTCVWLKDGDSESNWEEIDEPEEPEEEDESES